MRPRRDGLYKRLIICRCLGEGPPSYHHQAGAGGVRTEGVGEEAQGPHKSNGRGVISNASGVIVRVLVLKGVRD
jgi:hypothetical protein